MSYAKISSYRPALGAAARNRQFAAMPYALSIGLAGMTAIAAVAMLFVPHVLRGPAVMNGSARGTALVALFVAVPVLVAVLLAAARGWDRAPLLWLGAVAYLGYNAFLFLFATPFNQLFLIYVAMFSLAIWSAAAVLGDTNLDGLAERLRPRVPVRAIAIYVWLIVALNALLWLRVVVPAVLGSKPPAFLEGTGMTTNPIYVQDLAFWLPLMAVAAAWLWRRRPLGYVVVGSVLTMWVIESLGIAVDQWMGSAADPASTIASAAMTPVFAGLAAIGLVPLYFFYKR